MTKFYLEEEKVSSADEEHPSPELLCHRAWTVFGICHQRDAARLFHLWRGNNNSNKKISLAWQTTEALHPDELLQLLSIAPDGPSTSSAPAGDRSAPARFGTGIAVGASCHPDLGSRWAIKPQDTFTCCLHGPSGAQLATWKFKWASPPVAGWSGGINHRTV